MLDDIFKSIRAQLYERAVSPLMGSFVLSWSLWNYKFILLLFSEATIIEKYTLIEDVLFVTWPQILIGGFLGPLGTALFYLFIYPYPAKLVFKFSKNRQKEITNLKKEIEDETLLTIQESRTLRNAIRKMGDQFQEDFSGKDDKIKNLKEGLSSKDKKIKSLEHKSENIDEVMAEQEREYEDKIRREKDSLLEEYSRKAYDNQELDRLRKELSKYEKSKNDQKTRTKKDKQ